MSESIELRAISQKVEFYFEAIEKDCAEIGVTRPTMLELASALQRVSRLTDLQKTLWRVVQYFGFSECHLMLAQPLGLKTYKLTHLVVTGVDVYQSGYSQESYINSIYDDPFIKHGLNSTTSRVWSRNRDSLQVLARQSSLFANQVLAKDVTQIASFPWRDGAGRIGIVKYSGKRQTDFRMEDMAQASYLTSFLFEKFLHLQQLTRDDVTQTPSLTRREIDVLDQFIEGLSSREAAKSLGISIHTIVTHTKSIYKKLKVKSRQQAIRQANSIRIM